MSTSIRGRRGTWPQPLLVISLSGSLFFFIGSALSDWAYASSYEIQWENFASWLLAGALILSGIALAYAAADLRKPARRSRAGVLFILWLALGWIVGFFDVLMHARDACASMPAGLWMSITASAAVAVAVWLFFFSLLAGDAS